MARTKNNNRSPPGSFSVCGRLGHYRNSPLLAAVAAVLVSFTAASVERPAFSLKSNRHHPRPFAVLAAAAMSSSTTSPPPPLPGKEQKAIVYGPLDDPIQMVIDRPVPPPDKSGRVLVRVHAAGLNPVDAKDVIGDKLPHSWTKTRAFLKSHLLSNKIPGFDFAGTVVAAGDGAGGFKGGDEVYGTMPPMEGSLAEYVSAPVDQVCYKPRNLSMVESAALPLVGITTVQCLQPHVVAGTTSVLVIGASGGTGHVAVQTARALGAKFMTAVCSASSADFVRQQCGADEVVDYRRGADAMLEELQKSKGRPYGVVMDCVSSADPQDQKPINYPQWIQQHSDTLLTDEYVYRRLGGQSVDWIRAGLERTVGLNCWSDKHEKLFWIRFPRSVPELRQLQEWAESGRIKPHVAQIYGFSREGVRDAFDAILGRRVRGKVVIKVFDDGDKTQQQQE